MSRHKQIDPTAPAGTREPIYQKFFFYGEVTLTHPVTTEDARRFIDTEAITLTPVKYPHDTGGIEATLVLRAGYALEGENRASMSDAREDITRAIEQLSYQGYVTNAVLEIPPTSRTIREELV